MLHLLHEIFVAPWSWGAWVGRGALASSLAALCCGLLGVPLYLRRMSLLSDALAHVALPGIVFAYLVTGALTPGSLLVGAALAGVLSALLIDWLSRRPQVRPDASIGIVFTALFALGILLLSSVVRDAHIDVHCLLFGDLLGVSDRSIVLLLVCVPLTFGLLAVGRRVLLLGSFDVRLATALGLGAGLSHYVLTSAVAVVAVASFEAVGAILVVALLILPAATAHQLARSMGAMFAVAGGSAVVAAWAGLYVALWFDLAPAGCIVLVQGLLWLGAIALARLRERGVGAGPGGPVDSGARSR